MTDTKAGPIDKTVLLFSGGLDSVCYAQILRPDVLLYVPSGAAYQHKEDDALPRVASALPGRLVQHIDTLNLARIARPDAVVPGRNAYLVLLASNYGDTVWLGRASSDRQADSGPEFMRAMTALLNVTWSEQFWCRQRRFTVAAPLEHMSKTDLVRGFLAAGGNPQTLLDSVSCYDPEPGHCGVCKPCVHKRLALARAGVKTPDGYWRKHWSGAPWLTWARAAASPTVLRGPR